MFLKRKLAGALLTAGLALTLNAVASAQQPGPAPRDDAQRQEMPGREGKHRGMGRRGPGSALRLFRELNLSDAQREQIRAIRERAEASTKPQREELRRLHENRREAEMSADETARRQALRAEIGQAMRGMHQEMLNVLTAEQRAQLEQLAQERKARRDERRARRMNRRDDNDQ